MRLILLLSLLGCASQGVDSDVGVLQSAILNGVAEPGYTNTVLVMLSKPDRSVEMACTGVVIAPHVVLTAAHCVGTIRKGSTRCGTTSEPPEIIESIAKPESVSVAIDQIGYDAQEYRGTQPLLGVSRIEVPAEANSNLCGGDVAILELTDIPDVTPAPVRVAEAVVVGELVTAVGYGVDGEKGGDGQRRSRSGSRVSMLGKSMNGDLIKSTEGEWIMNIGGCGGDSGSPAFDANGNVVGIMSRGSSTKCVNMVYARVDEGGLGKWIEDTTIEISRTHRDPVPNWRPKAEPPPQEPATPPQNTQEDTQAVEAGCHTTTNSNGWVGAIVALAIALRRGKRVPKSLA